MKSTWLAAGKDATGLGPISGGDGAGGGGGSHEKMGRRDNQEAKNDAPTKKDRSHPFHFFDNDEKVILSVFLLVACPKVQVGGDEACKCAQLSRKK